MRYSPSRDSAASEVPRPAANSVSRSEARAGACWKRDGTAGGLLAVSCTYPVIVEIDLEDGVRREITVDLPVVKSSSQELEAVREQISLQLEQSRREPTDEVRRALQEREVKRQKLKKRFRAVRDDPVTGRIALLEQTPDYMGGGPATIHLLSSRGEYMAREGLDEEWIDFDFASGRLFALRRDSDGQGVEVVAYRAQAGGG